MKLADLKRLSIGTKLRLVHCLMGPVSDDKQPREVRRFQSNGMFLLKPDGRESWLDFPKASQFRSDDDGFTIFEDGEIAAQYKF